MSPLLFLAVLPPFLWAMVNHLDKFSVERYMGTRDPGALVVFTGVAALLFACVIGAFGLAERAPLASALPLMAAGFILTFSYVPYMYALKSDEASNVAPLFQLATPYAYILALVFLGERLPPLELLAGLMIFVGAILLSIDFKRTRIKLRTFLLMSLASVMVASNAVIFKSFALSTSFWTAGFYEMLGTVLAGLALFTIARYRRDLIAALREHGHIVASLSVGIESLSIVAALLYGFISLSLPIALVQFVTGFQPLFILLIGIMLTAWIPRFGIEAVDRRSLVRKFSAILLMVAGLVVLACFS